MSLSHREQLVTGLYFVGWMAVPVVVYYAAVGLGRLAEWWRSLRAPRHGDVPAPTLWEHRPNDFNRDWRRSGR